VSNCLPFLCSLTNVVSYFGRFEGFADCGIRAKDLYKLPTRDHHGNMPIDAFCPNRRTLLRALSDGGRIGYDAPYQSKGHKIHGLFVCSR
jgi:hypothetical protein